MKKGECIEKYRPLVFTLYECVSQMTYWSELFGLVQEDIFNELEFR